MKIFTFIFFLFVSVSALGQTRNTTATYSPKTLRLLDSTLHTEKMLILVDGVIYKDSLKNFDANEIRGIAILPDTDGVKIYGPSGANGVLLIMTNSKLAMAQIDSEMAKMVVDDPPPVKKTKVLYVVDGKQTYTYATDNKDMPNPNDILSVDVLKPNAATIRYGKLGANGAVIIRTKNGAVPLYEKKLSALSQKYKDYLLANHNNDAAIYYVINGEVIHENPDVLDKKLDKLTDGQIISADFYERWSKALNNEHILMIIKTK